MYKLLPLDASLRLWRSSVSRLPQNTFRERLATSLMYNASRQREVLWERSGSRVQETQESKSEKEVVHGAPHGSCIVEGSVLFRGRVAFLRSLAFFAHLLPATRLDFARV